MATTIVDVQQVEGHWQVTATESGRTGTETPDVTDYLNAKSVSIDSAIGLQNEY